MQQLIGLAILLGVLLAGCVSGYVAPALVAPMLSRKGDVAASAQVRPFQPAKGAHANIAVAPLDRLRVYASGSVASYRELSTSETGRRVESEKSRAQYGELGGGFGYAYKRLRMEALAGVGMGRVEATDYVCARGSWHGERCQMNDFVARYKRMSLQPVVGFVTRVWEAGMGGRFALSRFEFQEVHGAPSSRNAWVPGLEVFNVQRVGFRWIKLEGQVAWPIVLDSPKANGHRIIQQPGPYFTLGVHVSVLDAWRAGRDGVARQARRVDSQAGAAAQ